MVQSYDTLIILFLGYHNREIAPEWFTGGPTSQTDTIELHGFERGSSEDEDTYSEENTTTGGMGRCYQIVTKLPGTSSLGTRCD